ncbi:MAG: hypothetical protein ACRC2T_15845 [Thermoguttaceae bacterium]
MTDYEQFVTDVLGEQALNKRDTQETLCEFYKTKFLEMKKSRNLVVLKVLVVFLTLVSIAVCLNSTFDLQGFPYLPLVIVFLGVYIYYRYRDTFADREYSETDFLSQVLAGTPIEPAWHRFRIEKLLKSHPENCPVSESDKRQWLIIDAKRFLKKYPESELVRFYLYQLLCDQRRKNETDVILDEIIDLNGYFIKDAYQCRIGMFNDSDSEAAKQFREKYEQLKSSKKHRQIQKVDSANPLDFSLKVTLAPTLANAMQLLSESKLEEAITLSYDMEHFIDTINIHKAVAEQYSAKGHEKSTYAILNEAIKYVYTEEIYLFRQIKYVAVIAKIQSMLLGKDIARETFIFLINKAKQEPINGYPEGDMYNRNFYDIARLQFKLGLFADAVGTADLIVDETRKVELLVDKAEDYYMSGEMQNAAKLCDLAEKVTADNRDEKYGYPLEMVLRITAYYSETQNRPKAVEWFQKAVEWFTLTEDEDLFYDVVSHAWEDYSCNYFAEFADMLRVIPNWDKMIDEFVEQDRIMREEQD